MSSPKVLQIANILKTALPSAGLTEAAVLTRSTPGTRTAGSLAGGTNPTTTQYNCKAFIDTTTRDKIGGTLIESKDRIVSIVGATLAVVPRAGDTIAIDSATQRVISVEGNAALWTCLCRS